MESDGSIKNIANEVGYEDVYHFSKLFKKYYGVSPLNYRKQQQAKKDEKMRRILLVICFVRGHIRSCRQNIRLRDNRCTFDRSFLP